MEIFHIGTPEINTKPEDVPEAEEVKNESAVIPMKHNLAAVLFRAPALQMLNINYDKFMELQICRKNLVYQPKNKFR